MNGVREGRRTRAVLGVLLAVALALIAVSYSDPGSPLVRGLRSAGGAIFGGAEHAAHSVGGVFSSGTSSRQVTALQRQVTQLRAQLSAEQLSKSDSAQLRKLLLLAGAGQYKIVAASVVAVGQGYQQTITLDAGSGSGIRAGQTVISGAGLVGLVTAVTSSTATVLLASDPTAVIGVAVSPAGQLGWVTGPGKSAGAGTMRLEMLSSSATLKPGEAVVTAGSASDRPYVPGVPVGVITKLINVNGSLTEAAQVQPYVDYTALSVVGVVVARPARNPRFAAVPPLPHPRPAVTVTVTAKPGTGKPSTAPAPRASP